MKKIVACITILFIIFLYAASCSAVSGTTITGSINDPSGVRLFYNGNTYILSHAVSFYDNEYFFDAQQLSVILGIKYQVDRPNQSIKVNFNKIESVYPYKSLSLENHYRHDTPEFLNTKLLFPFTFLKNSFNLVIKYNADNGALYILPQGSVSSSQIKTFTNESYNYSISLPEGVEIETGESENNYQDSIISISDKENAFSAVITCDRLGESSLNIMRQYLGDYTSNDEEIFSKLANYKKSYFEAVQDYYKRNFLYGSNDENSSESNIKVYGEYHEKVYGQDSYITLYNTIKSDKLTSREETHIDISIPVYIYKSIYSLNFTVRRGYLNATTLSRLSELVNSINILGLSKQEQALSVFSDENATQSANQGIYPDLRRINITYNDFVDRESGYKLTYPSTFIPYMQNNIVDSFDYRSFKINYNHYISVSVEPAHTSSTAVMNKVKVLKDFYKGNIYIIDEGTVLLSGKEMQFLKYQLTDSNQVTFVEDYFVVNNSRLYDIRLNSRFIRPSTKIQDEFEKVVASLEFITPPDPINTGSTQFIKFTNNEEGYSFLHPADWDVLEGNSTDVNYDSFKIISPEYSGPVDISVSEGEVDSSLSYTDILTLVSNADTTQLDKYFKKYDAPYQGMVSKPLVSSYHVTDGAIYLYKLVNYLDSSNRSKFCYSTDIIRGQKIYSLFISVSDYIISNGEISDKNLSSIVNTISASFGLEDTPEYAERQKRDENRNRKVVFIEDYFKQKFGASARVTSAVYLTPPEYILVTLDKVPGSGFYKIKMDFDKKEIYILDKALKKDILNAVSRELKKRYTGKIIEDIVPFENDMTVDIEYYSSQFSPLVHRTYEVDMDITQNRFNWNLVRKDHSDALKNDCKSYFENSFLTDADIHFASPDEFSNINSYQNSGQKYYTAIYADMGQYSGYYVLQINPLNDDINIISYTPVENLCTEVKELYSSEISDYAITSFSLSDVDKFELKVLGSSKQSGLHRMDKIKVKYNRTTQKLDLIL